MRNVKCPEAFTSFTHKKKKKTLFNKLPENRLDTHSIAIILGTYDEYVRHKTCLEQLLPADFEDEISKERWEYIYNHSKVELLKKWRELLGENNIPSRCPSCGISTPSDAEHFLSRSRFREFSLFLLNLIPWCSICNRKKGTAIVDDAGIRKFLNCYWDDIDKYCFWECQADIVQNKISFIVVRPSECPEYLFKIVKNHANYLDLPNRFLKLGTDKFSEIIIELSQYNPKTISFEHIISVMNARISSMTRIYGVNYWERVLYIGFLKNLTPDIWQYIISQNQNNLYQ